MSSVSACQPHLHNTKHNPGDARLNMTQCALCLMYNITGSQCQRAEEEERPWAIDQCPGSRGEESVRLQYSPLRWPTHCPHHTIIITYRHQTAQGANNTHYIIISLQNTRGLLSKQLQPLNIGYKSVLFGLVHFHCDSL